MNEDLLVSFPYTAISVSILARFIFFFLLYKNKSANSYSLTFCILNICSSSLWIFYSIHQKDIPMVARSGVEILLLVLSSCYIIRNKYKAREAVLPIQNS